MGAQMSCKKQNYGSKFKKMKRKNNTVFLTRGAAIAAIYVISTYLSHIFGLSSGVIQMRLSEMLCVMPAFLFEAVPGLSVGCAVSNILTGGMALDVLFGALATLIGALGAFFLGKAARKISWLGFFIPLPTVAANTLIIPFVLSCTYGAREALPFIFLSVGIGEVLSAWVLGLLLFFSLKRVFVNIK